MRQLGTTTVNDVASVLAETGVDVTPFAIGGGVLLVVGIATMIALHRIRVREGADRR